MSRRFDVCNGDADGLCAALQWRLQHPGPATLVTGLKRDIALLQQVRADPGDEVDVFDLSMRRNLEALLRLLDAGVRVRYFDHHAADRVPTHPLLVADIDSSGEACASLLVDRSIGGALRAWALVGAYGDNLAAAADRLAAASGFDERDRLRLRRLGEVINYNAYGDDETDVLIAPARLYAILARYRDPRELLAREAIVDQIDAQRQADLAQASAVAPYWQDTHASVLVLPDAPWSRRVLGCYANALAAREPDRAHALLRQTRAGYAVSVRAPLASATSAHDLCERFGGGGRARAAGVDALPRGELERFRAAFAGARWSGTAYPSDRRIQSRRP